MVEILPFEQPNLEQRAQRSSQRLETAKDSLRKAFESSHGGLPAFLFEKFREALKIFGRNDDKKPNAHIKQKQKNIRA